MAKIDIEEKFKKDISKEVANLKEFLISQGKEIVKLKQENKAMRETSVTSVSSTGEKGVPPEMKALLDKHTVALEKQKENTTKLSKLCLGTLNELEKFEKKQERETSAAPKTEDRIKRLTDENKKLIHLVTTLDQQVALLDGKLNKNIFDSEELAKRVRHSSVDKASKQAGGVGELTREEVFRIVRENVPAPAPAPAPAPGKDMSREEVTRIVRENLQQSEENNLEKNAQVQSVIAEVQNIIGQIRELGMQFRELTEKVRVIEGNDTNERFGLELAGALSRIQKIEVDGAATANHQPPQPAPIPDTVTKRIAKVESDMKRVDKLENSVGLIEKLDKELKSSHTVANEAKEQVKKVEQELNTTIKTVGTVKASMDEALRTMEADGKVSKDAKNSIVSLEKELTKTTTMATAAKTSVEDVMRKVERIQKEEEAARSVRKDQNMFSVEDIKKDFVKVQEQTNYLEEKMVSIQKLSDSTGIESKNKNNKLIGEIELLSEKVKNMSLTIKDEKFKTDEKISKIDNQSETITKFKEDAEKKISSLGLAQTKIEKSLTSAEEMSKTCKTDAQSLKSDLTVNKSNTDKCAKNIEENNTKIFGCVHDVESLKDSLEKLKKNVERRPAAEDIDKKSELSNKLYNDLSAKIDDVDSNLKKEVKKTRSDIEKCNKDVKNIESKCDNVESASTTDIKAMKDELNVLKTSNVDVKNCSKDISSLKSDCDKNTKDLKNMTTKVEDMKKETSSQKLEWSTISTKIEKLQVMEKDLEVMKKEKPLDKFTSIEKDVSSLRADHEKLNKDVKGLSTEVKYVDSTLKKESSNTKTEISAFSKNIKEFEKDLNTIHNMVDVLNSEKGSTANSDDVTKIKADLSKVSTEIKDKNKILEDSLNKKINTDIKDVETKLQKTKDDILSKVTTCSTEVKTLEKKMEDNSKGIESTEVDKKVKTAKDELISSVDMKIKTTKEEIVTKVTANTTQIKAIEKKVDTNNTSKDKMVEPKDIDNKIKLVKDELIASCDTKVQKCKEELTTKITLSDTKVQKTKDDLTASFTKCSTDQKALEKRLDTAFTDLKKFGDVQLKVTKQEEGISKMQKTIDNLDVSSKSNKSGDELKKEVDKINQQIKDNLKTVEGKISTQETQAKTLEGKITKTETQVTEIKTSMKDINGKIDNLPKQDTSTSKPDDSVKKDIDKINQTVIDKIDKINIQIKDTQKTLQDKITGQDKTLTDKISQQVKDCQKTLQDKMSAQDKSVKDATEKIAKLEKGDSSATKSGGETAKLVTLTKAIDAIQENSKSLETMVKKMKTEFSTPKDLEKLRVELSGKVGGGIDPNHPDMGPIMDSLIMTNDRPYIDCATVTPMTGNGLVKFERFNAMNKLPWDDMNDQFVIQEPGVYAVFVTAILQDAVLSVKIASNMMEREIFNVGSREGLVGCSSPTFVSRGGLLQIDDDENVADTILVEIHADNEESFVDKNVTLTMYKIGESPGGE